MLIQLWGSPCADNFKTFKPNLQLNANQPETVFQSQYTSVSRHFDDRKPAFAHMECAPSAIKLIEIRQKIPIQ
jgi:hypothetical protein